MKKNFLKYINKKTTRSIHSFERKNYTEGNLTRKELLQRIEESYIDKYSNYLINLYISNDEFSLNDWENKVKKITDNNLAEKYNMDFSNNSLHTFIHPVTHNELPIYCSLNHVDLFFSKTAELIIQSVIDKSLFKILEHPKFGLHMDIDIGPIIHGDLTDYFNVLRVKVLNNMSRNHGLKYMDIDDNERFFNGKLTFNDKIDRYDTSYIPLYMLESIPNTEKILLDAINNNFFHRTCNTKLYNDRPEIIEQNLLNSMRDLAVRAKYLPNIDESNVDEISYGNLITMLDVDVIRHITIQTYDPFNRLLIDLPKDYTGADSQENLANDISEENYDNMSDTDMDTEM